MTQQPALGPAGIDGYFEAVRTSFSALDSFFEAEGAFATRHDLVFQVVQAHVERLRASFECWWNAIAFADGFKVDAEESGFPTFPHVLALQDDLKRAQDKLEEIAEPPAIRAEILEELLKYRRFPASQQHMMAERLYFETLVNKGFFPDFTAPETIRHSVNKRTERPYYVVHWAVYDGSASLPLVYIAVIEDSTPSLEAPGSRGPWARKKTIGPGLPNSELATRFRDFVAANSSYGLTLTTIATAMDEEFPTLHPKQLRRMVLGPFYVGGLTAHGPLVQTILNGVGAPANAWLLTWTLQELYSQSETPARHGIWSSEPPKEHFYINTQDIDCVQQGVSAIERHALIPHDAYQAIYAVGAADKILKGHQTHIVSGGKLLRHV